jgi:hypothetical protein
MNKVTFSCMGCQERFPGCHGTCAKYKKERTEYDKRKEETKKKRDIEAGLNNYFYDSFHKCTKRIVYRKKYRKGR